MLINADLIGIDVNDPNLTTDIKLAILEECRHNPYYYWSVVLNRQLRPSNISHDNQDTRNLTLRYDSESRSMLYIDTYGRVVNSVSIDPINPATQHNTNIPTLKAMCEFYDKTLGVKDGSR